MENTLELPEIEKIPPADESKKKTYVKPQLQELGDLRTNTLGGSPGGGDSNPPGPFVSLP